MTEARGMFAPGDLVDGKYRIEKVLGEGGMGVVYAAQHEMLAQSVAIKVVRPEIADNDEIVRRFIQEARSVAKIENEHVARVTDVGRFRDGTPYMVMELLVGDDLDALLRSEGPLPPETVADLMLEALVGISAAHAIGIVHRDLKPANLFLADKPGRASVVKVLDFGISKALGGVLDSAQITSTKSILGSPSYMAPEQLRSSKRVDTRADIWSLGVIVYQLSTGKLPYEAEDVGGLFAAILEDLPVPARQANAALPEGWERLILRCLEKKPGDRFQTVRELGSALATFGTSRGARALERIAQTMPPSEDLRASGMRTSEPLPPSAASGYAATHASSPGMQAVRPPDPVVATLPLRSRTVPERAPEPAPPLAPTPQLKNKTDGNWATHGSVRPTPKPRGRAVPVAIGATLLLAALGGAVLLGGRDSNVEVSGHALLEPSGAPVPAAPSPTPTPPAPSSSVRPPATGVMPIASTPGVVPPPVHTKPSKQPTSPNAAPNEPPNDLFSRH